MMFFRSLIALAIVLIISSEQPGGAAKSLNVKYQVRFRRLPPKEFAAALGSSITIECEANASPPPTIHWLKDGKRLYLNDMEANQLEEFEPQASLAPVDDVNRMSLSATRSRLYIDCADISDEATYTCVAENAYSRVSSHTKLNLIRPAAVQLAPAAEADGAPAGGIENDLSLSELGGGGGGGGDGGASNAGAVVGQQLQRRELQSVGAASQASGAGNLAADLAALTAVPQCLTDKLANVGTPQAPARIHMWTHSIAEIMTNDVIIYCRSNVNRQPATPTATATTTATGSSSSKSQQMTQATLTSSDARKQKPASATVWTLPDDKPVTEESRAKYEVLETGDLLIRDLRWSDMGTYVCTVSDERSSDSISTFVYPLASAKVKSKRATAAARQPLARIFGWET